MDDRDWAHRCRCVLLHSGLRQQHLGVGCIDEGTRKAAVQETAAGLWAAPQNARSDGPRGLSFPLQLNTQEAFPVRGGEAISGPQPKRAKAEHLSPVGEGPGMAPHTLVLPRTCQHLAF